MLRSIFLLIVYVSFLAGSLSAPFVATLGYLWVDTFRPQGVAYIVLNQIPVAAVMGAVAIGSYLMMDRRSPPPLNTVTVLQVITAVWVTVTMTWSVAGAFGWSKWDWAFKTVVFFAFVPFVIRSRVQIEAFIQTYLMSLAANIVPFGLKTLIAGGGYGKNLGLVGGNSGLAEGGFLSTACLMAIPLALFLARNTILVPRWWFTPFLYWGIAATALITAIGTYQRSALIGLVCMGGVLIARSRHKFAYLVMAAIVGAGLFYATSDEWSERISTIRDYKSETSAYSRILVWQWTLEFVKSYPLGGGFNAYVINHIVMPGDEDNPGGSTSFGRAFHSIYFEMLGEHGWPGLLLFLTIAGLTLLSLFGVSRRTARIPELEWCASLALALQAGLVAFLTAGAFVGLAFQPMFWSFVAMSVSLRAYVWRVLSQPTVPTTGWRAAAQSQVPPPHPGGVTQPGWKPALTGRVAKPPPRRPGSRI
jgi:probable O-glycosylation ligase (exosortase A-associated)